MRQPALSPRLLDAVLDDVRVERIDAPGLGIAQGGQGFMLFGGEEGLFRYDGFTFTRFQHDPNDPSSLSATHVEVLCADIDGVLRIGDARRPESIRSEDGIF